MKKLIMLFSLVLCSLPTFAISGQYGISSDYMWRGISQSNGNPAINFGIEQQLGAGFYAGAWASTIDFNDDNNVELDLYGGYSIGGNNWNIDLGYIAYRYDHDNDLNFDEVYLSVAYGPVKVGSYHDEDNDRQYDFIDVSLPFLKFADVTLHYGDQDGFSDKSVNVEYALSDSMSIGVMVMSHIRNDNMEIEDAVSVHFVSKF